jgi:serine/threonine protein phosphatase PrpC
VSEGQVKSVGFTHPGKVRDINQDAFIELSDAGVWVVADGMGGHLEGERASRLIIDAVSWATPRLGLEATTDEISLRLANVNQMLINERHDDSKESQICGSTVVALIIKKNYFSCVWAGDSRLYLLRDGVLRTVTQDHSLQEERGEDSPRNIITRAVGATTELELDLLSEALQIGDRLMLCSDGIYGELSSEEIKEALSANELGQAINNLTQCVLSKAARDNLTAVLVDYN